MVTFTHRQPSTPEEAWRAAGVLGLPRLPDGVLDGVALIVLAAHPDDELLGCAGLIAGARDAGIPLSVLLFTAGENSHPGSPTHGPEELARIRLDEFARLTRELCPDAPCTYLGLTDGGLTEEAEHIRAVLERQIEAVRENTGRPVVVVAPFHEDGHADHETLGTVALGAAETQGVGVLEYPLWYWHWADPSDERWTAWRHVPVPSTVDRTALWGLYPSQTEPLSPADEDAAILPRDFREHFERPVDIFALTRATHHADHAGPVFDAVHRRSRDPWQTLSSEYERRKRDLLMSCLPRDNRRTLEIGCSVGTLTRDLAEISEAVVGMDASPRALDIARDALSHSNSVELRLGVVPRDWPDEPVDLVVLSETGFYLSEEQLRLTFDHVDAERATGPVTLALCHWRGDIEGWPLDAEGVHGMARARWPGARVSGHEDPDFLIDVFRLEPEDPRS